MERNTFRQRRLRLPLTVYIFERYLVSSLQRSVRQYTITQAGWSLPLLPLLTYRYACCTIHNVFSAAFAVISSVLSP
jgi:hypothetical protein